MNVAQQITAKYLRRRAEYSTIVSITRSEKIIPLSAGIGSEC